MRFVLLGFMLIGGIAASDDCPDIRGVQEALESGDIPTMQRAVDCGFDPHLGGDKALHIAVRADQREMEAYLRGLGLREHGAYLRNVWLADHFGARSLYDSAQLYRLDNGRLPPKDHWKDALTDYTQHHKDGPFTDTWGNSYVYTTKPAGFCSFGRDARPGGELYDQDVCSYTDQRELLDLLPTRGN